MKPKVIFLVIATLALAKNAWGQEVRVARDMKEALEMARHSSCVITSGRKGHGHHGGHGGYGYGKGRQNYDDDYDQDGQTQQDYDDYGQSEEDFDDDPPRRPRPPPLPVGPIGPPPNPTYPVNLPIQFPLNVGQVLGSITGSLPQGIAPATLGGLEFGNPSFGIQTPQRDPVDGTEVSLSSAPDWGAVQQPQLYGGKGGGGGGYGHGGGYGGGGKGKGGKGKGGKGKGGKGHHHRPGNINCIIITKKKGGHQHHKKKPPPSLFGFLPFTRRRRNVARALKEFKNL